MARKNKNAGQPNRGAQITRHANRRYNNERFSYRRSDADRSHEMVLGPGSDNLSTGRVYGEIITRELYLVGEVA